MPSAASLLPQTAAEVHSHYPRLANPERYRDPGCPSEVLALSWVQHEWRDDISEAIASNPACPPETVDWLALEADRWEVRLAALANPNLSEHAMLRYAMAPRAEAPEPGQDQQDLYQDYADEHIAIAGNPNCTPKVLLRLSYSPDRRVLNAVAKHLNTPGQVLEGLALGDYYGTEVRQTAASNPSLPLERIQKLLRDPHRQVAQAAADNPALSPAQRAMWQLAH